jgi:hypothetical protein
MPPSVNGPQAKLKIKQKKARDSARQCYCSLKATIVKYSTEPLRQPLKVHKRENFLGFDFEICTFSLLVMPKC